MIIYFYRENCRFKVGKKSVIIVRFKNFFCILVISNKDGIRDLACVFAHVVELRSRTTS